MYNFSCIRSLQDLTEFKSEILFFESRLPTGSLFTSYAWIETWIKAYHSDQELLLLIIRDGSEMVGFIPLVCVKASAFKIPIKRLEFISISSQGDIIQFPHIGDFAPIARSFIEFLNNCPIAWDILYLESVDEFDTDIQLLNYLASKTNFRTEIGTVIENQRDWYIPINGNWEQYYASLSRNHRNSYRNHFNRLKKTGEVTVQLYNNSKNISEAWADLLRVDRDSWQYHENIGISSQKNHLFFQTLIDSFCDQGLEIWILKVNGQPIAFEFLINFKFKIYGLRWGFNQNFSKYSPGTILRMRSLEYYFKNNVYEFDLLGKFDSAKQKWTAHFRQQIELLIFNTSLKNRFVHDLKYGISPHHVHTK